MWGTCRLCLSEADLQDSHILPKWSYKKARGTGSNPNPVIIEDGKALQHPKQKSEHLLCRACEQRIGSVENHISQLVYQDSERAPFLDRVGNVMHASGSTRMALAGSLNTAALVYFGASVVWRASVSNVIKACSLGRYNDEFRRYVLGEAPFPERAACVVTFYDLPLNSGDRITSMCLHPSSQRSSGCHFHRFLVHGLSYFLAVGSQIPAGISEFCLERGAPKYVSLASQETLLDSLADDLRGIRAVGKLATPTSV